MPGRSAPRAMRTPISLGAALDGVAVDAVEADGGEDEGEDAEEAGHVGDGALLIEVGVDLLAHGQDVEEGEVGVDVGEDVADLGSRPSMLPWVWRTAPSM